MPNNPNNAEVERLAREAKADIAWLAGLHGELKHAKVKPQGWPCDALPMGTFARLMLTDSNMPPFGFSEEVTEEEANYYNEAFGLFRNAVSEDQRVTPTDPAGHYLNKAAVVYAVAVAEYFVVEAFKAKFGTAEPLDSSASLGSYIDVIAKRIPGFDEGAKGARFVAQLRHVIVHCGGIVDEKFLGQARKLLDKKTWNGWKAEFAEKGPVWLHVVKVTIPCLRWILAFIEEAKEKFISAP